MKQRSFILTVVGINVFIMFFLIYKNSLIVELLFQKQQHEKIKINLLREKDALQQKLCLIQNKNNIKKFAKNELKMEKIVLDHIKKLPTNHENQL